MSFLTQKKQQTTFRVTIFCENPLKTPEMFLSYRAPRFSDLPPPKFLGATVATVSANSTRLGAADQPWLHQIECFPGLVCGGSQCVFFFLGGGGIKASKTEDCGLVVFSPMVGYNLCTPFTNRTVGVSPRIMDSIYPHLMAIA